MSPTPARCPKPCRGARPSECWVRRLACDGRTGEEAVLSLHRLLLRVAYSRLLNAADASRGDVDELALEAADEALVRVLRHLEDFRGESLFTTWACRFALTEAAAALRRRRHWRLEAPTELDAMARLAGPGQSVEHLEEEAEVLRVVGEAIGALSRRQREVLLAMVVEGRPARALTGELRMSTGALYKSLHDARRKLRARLEDHGLAVGESRPVTSA